jgi:hypothetical protein
MGGGGGGTDPEKGLQAKGAPGRAAFGSDDDSDDSLLGDEPLVSPGGTYQCIVKVRAAAGSPHFGQRRATTLALPPRRAAAHAVSPLLHR